MRELLVEYFKTKNFDVSSAGDGRAAQAAILKEPARYGIVLTDLQLPGVDGLGVLRTVKQANPSAYVVIVTGYASLDSAIQAVRLGAYDYLTKPFSLGQIDVVLQRVRDRVALEVRESAPRAPGQSARGHRRPHPGPRPPRRHRESPDPHRRPPPRSLRPPRASAAKLRAADPSPLRCQAPASDRDGQGLRVRGISRCRLLAGRVDARCDRCDRCLAPQRETAVDVGKPTDRVGDWPGAQGISRNSRGISRGRRFCLQAGRAARSVTGVIGGGPEELEP